MAPGEKVYARQPGPQDECSLVLGFGHSGRGQTMGRRSLASKAEKMLRKTPSLSCFLRAAAVHVAPLPGYHSEFEH